MAQVGQRVWEYQDACLRGDRAAVDAAWQACRLARQRQWRLADDYVLSSAMRELVRLASELGDLDRAARELLEWYPCVDTSDLDNDHKRRGLVFSFLLMCVALLQQEAFLDHPRHEELYAALRDVAARSDRELTGDQRRAIQLVGELSAFHRCRAAIARSRRSSGPIIDGLPPLSPIVGGERSASPAAYLPATVGLLGRDQRLTLVLAWPTTRRPCSPSTCRSAVARTPGSVCGTSHARRSR